MLHLHRSADADVLVDGLAALLAKPVTDVFAPEIVAVPAKGVERWLAQRLSQVEAGVSYVTAFFNPSIRLLPGRSGISSVRPSSST